MLPDKLIPATITHAQIAPSYLDATDLPWIEVLLDQLRQFIGRPERDLDERLSLPFPCAAPPFKLRATIACVRKMWQPVVDAAIKPPKARELLFLAGAADEHNDRAQVIARVAAEQGLSVGALEHAIIADLPGERRLRPPAVELDARGVAQHVNELIVRSLLARARRVIIRAEGAIRAVVRQAKLSGLLCILRDEPTGPVLEISGPFSLFRHTVLYGRALGSLLGRLPYCGRFELTAHCCLRDQEAVFSLRSDDSIFRLTPGSLPRAYDSNVEARFARDLKRAAPDWELVREPEAIRAGRTLVFPDFAIVHRLDPRRRFLIEIAGFWTAEYLTKKLAALHSMGRRDLILCIDSAHQCDDAELPPLAGVLRYKRHVEVKDLVRIIEQAGPTADGVLP